MPFIIAAFRHAAQQAVYHDPAHTSAILLPVRGNSR